ncbi:unnamed protein product [Brassicogethes aeneus]|uniref:MD-2-related lipid-recognition domain-containing protein n=1 Tax=Brassicogethes aeneus TaxID=1431903 RepID=A0A9P0AZK9_BRAAE|nr:unnamed protein product [Brassicogethes aeneus]
MNLTPAFVLLVVAIGYGTATQVRKCQGGSRSIDELSKLVRVGNCKKPPCRLRKNSAIDVTLKFSPEFPVESLKNSVTAAIVGVPFPFVGVDGEDACQNVFQEDGTTKAGCPLEAGKNYVYKNKIDVLQIYPNIKVVVHWGLTSPKGDVICFEVPARITS